MRKRLCKGIIVLGFGILLAYWGWNRYVIGEEKVLQIIYIPKIVDNENEFWTALIAGAKMAAQEENVELTVAAPEAEDDYERQNELIRWAIEQNPDAIMISACDYTGNTKAAQEVKAAGIPLVFIDSDVQEDVGDCTVATDNFIAGTKIGELAGDIIDGSTQIAIVSHVKNSSTAIERIEGIQYALGEASNQIVDIVYCDSSYEKAEELTGSLLETYPDLGLIIGTNEYAAVGAAQAVKSQGYQNQICMIGFDSSIEQVQFLEEHLFEGIVIQKAFNMGYLGVEQASAIARGETYEKQIDSGSVLITRSNMDETENQKLLFPFVGKQFRETIQNEVTVTP